MPLNTELLTYQNPYSNTLSSVVGPQTQQQQGDVYAQQGQPMMGGGMPPTDSQRQYRSSKPRMGPIQYPNKRPPQQNQGGYLNSNQITDPSGMTMGKPLYVEPNASYNYGQFMGPVQPPNAPPPPTQPTGIPNYPTAQPSPGPMVAGPYSPAPLPFDDRYYQTAPIPGLGMGSTAWPGPQLPSVGIDPSMTPNYYLPRLSPGPLAGTYLPNTPVVPDSQPGQDDRRQYGRPMIGGGGVGASGYPMQLQ